MRNDRLTRRFQIILHIVNRLDAPGAAARPAPGAGGGHSLDSLPNGDWLGHETRLFEAAAAAIRDLEDHLSFVSPPTGVNSRYKPVDDTVVLDGPPWEIPWRIMDWEQIARLRPLLGALIGAFMEAESTPAAPPGSADIARLRHRRGAASAS
ncbi:MAG TPA: hypothetical protein VL181_01990 [Holophagaceae bacterium]|nr:hypothetical protein [Holophagaceae bacterium]